jgi:alkylation response protein AidB-like acyl-CoA dehydrogenase
VTVAVHTGAATLPITLHGTPEQIERFVPPLAAGDELAAFALTEPEAGSDASSLRTQVKDGRISGAKQWITNGSHASTFLVFAREPSAGVTAHLVRADSDGFAVTREEDKLGLNSSSTADLSFNDTPAERLGEPGGGMRVALTTLDGGRIAIAAQAVGIAQAAFELATSYAQERTAFGGPIARFQAIQHKLADMQTEIEAARALTWRAGTAQGRRTASQGRGRPGQALRERGRPPADRRGDSDPRRLRLHEGVPGRSLLPRRQGHRDIRRNKRDPADGHRPWTAWAHLRELAPCLRDVRSIIDTRADAVVAHCTAARDPP